MKKIKIYITGGTGFIGRELILRLNKSLNKVIIKEISRNKSKDKINLANFNEVYDSISKFKPDIIVHLAASGVTRNTEDLSNFVNFNLLSTINILETIKNLRNSPLFVNFGTAYEYKHNKNKLTENSNLNPMSLYAWSKTSSYYLLKTYQDKARILNLRLFNIYGPKEPNGRLIPYLLDCVCNKEIAQTTNGSQIRDFMYIDDLIIIIEKIIFKQWERSNFFKTVNIGTGRPCSIKKFINLIKKELHKRSLALEVDFNAISPRKEDPLVCVSNNNEMLRLIGKIDFISNQVGIERYLNEYYKDT